MSGTEYLDAIRSQLESGKSAWRRADDVFRSFGYVRRRRSAVDQFNRELADHGLTAEPAPTTAIPMSMYVRFFLAANPLPPEAIAVAQGSEVRSIAVEPEAPLLDVVELFKNHDAVLVQGPDKVVRGIVTPVDIADEFPALAGPFLLIGQIEEQLRWLVKRWLERAQVDLAAALKLETDSNPGKATPKDVTDLTMGELLWILTAEDNWKGIGIKYDRVTFRKEFDAVREIRNAVMHFKDIPGSKDYKRVQDFAAVVQRAYLAVC